MLSHCWNVLFILKHLIFIHELVLVHMWTSFLKKKHQIKVCVGKKMPMIKIFLTKFDHFSCLFTNSNCQESPFSLVFSLKINTLVAKHFYSTLHYCIRLDKLILLSDLKNKWLLFSRLAVLFSVSFCSWVQGCHSWLHTKTNVKCPVREKAGDESLIVTCFLA